MNVEQTNLSTNHGISRTPPSMKTVRVTTKLRSWYLRWVNESPKTLFLLPTILIILFLSIFPLLASLYLSFARIDLVKGGFEITFFRKEGNIDYLHNYKKLLEGS